MDRHQPDLDSGARQSAAVGLAAGRGEERQNLTNGQSGATSPRFTVPAMKGAAF